MALTVEGKRFARLIVSALIAGAIGVGSNLLTAVSATGEIQRGSLLLAVITGALLTLKDVQAYLSTPPGP